MSSKQLDLESSPSGVPQSAVDAPTQFVEAKGERYAYRRFGKTGALPLVFLQHFTGRSTTGILRLLILWRSNTT